MSNPYAGLKVDKTYHGHSDFYKILTPKSYCSFAFYARRLFDISLHLCRFSAIKCLKRDTIYDIRDTRNEQ